MKVILVDVLTVYHNVHSSSNSSSSSSSKSSNSSNNQARTRQIIEVSYSFEAYHMLRLSDVMYDIRPTNDEVSTNDSRMTIIVQCGTLSVVKLTVKLFDVAYMPALSCNPFELMVAHKSGVGFRADENDTSIYPFHGRIRFKRDVSIFWPR